jgi:hypothetical protein
LKYSVAIVLFFVLSVPAGTAYPADGKIIMSRTQLLREHHKLMHHMLMVMRDNVDITGKLLEGKMTAAQRKTMKKRMTDLTTEVEGMVEKHENLMKTFEEMTKKQEVAPIPEEMDTPLP